MTNGQLVSGASPPVLGEGSLSGVLQRRVDEFAAAASHDLGVPLCLISGGLEELRDQTSPRDPRSQESMHTIQIGIDRLRKLVDGIAQYTRIGAEEAELQPVDVDGVVRETLEALSFMVRELEATVLIGDLPVVSGHPILLHQLFQNLISNALKFHGDEPPVVEIACDRGRADRLTFSVSDNGVGVSPADATRIFDMFARSGRSGERPGSGIGLAIAARAVAWHGGRIWVESDGSGSTFKFTIPRQA
jgi:signal transduction histidine kinase